MCEGGGGVWGYTHKHTRLHACMDFNIHLHVRVSMKVTQHVHGWKEYNVQIAVAYIMLSFNEVNVYLSILIYKHICCPNHTVHGNVFFIFCVLSETFVRFVSPQTDDLQTDFRAIPLHSQRFLCHEIPRGPLWSFGDLWSHRGRLIIFSPR